MQIEFPQQRGQITEFTVTPENAAEAVSLNFDHRWFDPTNDPVPYAEFITNPSAQTVSMGPRSIKEGAGYVEVEVEIVQSMDPYVRMLQDRTGHCLEDHEDTIDLMPALGQAKATRLLLSAVYHPGALRVRAIVAAYGEFEEHDDIARHQKAEKWLLQGLHDDLGEANFHREFIECSNGQYKPNPDYGTGRRIAPTVCVGHEKVWNAIWSHWQQNHANAAQRALLNRFSTFRNGPKTPSVRDYQGFHVDNYESHVSWDELAQAD
jgi:hypothetical protein